MPKNVNLNHFSMWRNEKKIIGLSPNSNEEDEEGKDDVRKETWEVQHLALGTRSRQQLFQFCYIVCFT